MSDKNLNEEDVQEAQRNWKTFVQSTKVITVVISIVVLLLGIAFTDLF